MIRAESELRYVKGVGPRRAAALAEGGLKTLEDLLYVLPFRYEDRRAFARIAELLPGGADRVLSVEIRSSRLIRTRRRNFTIFEAELADESGTIRAVWYNQPYLERVLVAGRRAVLFGRATLNRYRRLVVENPDYEFIEDEDSLGIHTGRIVPVYRKLADMTSRQHRQVVFQLLAELDDASLGERVPASIGKRNALLSRAEALRRTHFPPPETAIAQLAARSAPAQRTLVFEEVFLLQLALALRQSGLRDEARGIAYELTDGLRTRLGRLLPFKLTAAQRRVLKEIGADLRSGHPMNRLLQGDVGSGKTIVALLTLLVAVDNGYQGALMAPTEILADQHFRNIRQLLDSSGIDCRLALLTGSLRQRARRGVLEAIASGSAGLTIGTHALFEQGVEFRRLGLVVIDEQHRFGVLQRAALAGKGLRPDVLVMTATPIPRSLALTLYGDLDLSVIDELPPGRTPVRTVVRSDADRERVYSGLRRQVAEGRQAYVVVPLVEETAKSDLKAAVAFAEQLRGELPDLRVGLLHGRLKGPDKDAVMQAFAAGELDVLVATTVIEVGVDVSNATVMIVEHAERFGLSSYTSYAGASAGARSSRSAS